MNSLADIPFMRTQQELVTMLNFIENDAMWFSVGCNNVKVFTVYRDMDGYRQIFNAIRRAVIDELNRELKALNKNLSESNYDGDA